MVDAVMVDAVTAEAATMDAVTMDAVTMDAVTAEMNAANKSLNRHDRLLKEDRHRDTASSHGTGTAMALMTREKPARRNPPGFSFLGP